MQQLYFYMFYIIMLCYISLCGSGSSVVIVTDYGLDGPGIESQWGRDFPRLSSPALGPTEPPVQRALRPSRGQIAAGGAADHSPPSSAEVIKE
jgi:hypothetical protein